MDLVRIGTVITFGGGLLALYERKMGGIVLCAGVLLIIIGGNPKEEITRDRHVPPSEPHYRVVGDQMLMLDEDDNVLGTTALPKEKTQRKLVGSNKK